MLMKNNTATLLIIILFKLKFYKITNLEKKIHSTSFLHTMNMVNMMFIIWLSDDY